MVMDKERAGKNSWMSNPELVDAAVKAVQEGYPLPWNRSYRVGFSTWEDFKRAAAWVSRERKKRGSQATSTVRAYGATQSRKSSDTRQKTSSKAAIALREADAIKEAKKAEKDRLRAEAISQPNAQADVNSVEKQATDFVKGTGFQFLWLIAIIPLAILFGTTARSGLVTLIFVPIAFVLGILILIFRFVRAMAGTVKSGKPVPKDWYK